MINYERLNKMYRESWGKVTDKALGIDPADVESQARSVAKYAYARITHLEEVLQGVLLFHSATPWDTEKQERWEELMGDRDTSTKGLCDGIREVLNLPSRE